MVETDSAFSMVPWKKENEIKHLQIRKLEEIPKTLGAFKNYFHRANPKDEGGRAYVDVYIKHRKPFKELKEDLAYFFTSTRTNMYYKDIQAEKATQLGYLLYSIEGMDQTLLFQQLSKIARVKIAGRFRHINSEKWEKVELPKQIRALHLECSSEHHRQAKITLSNMYHYSATVFPLGIRMRWVPEIASLQGQNDSIKKATLLRGRQSQFKAMMQMCVNDEITIMDVVDKDRSKSLRDVIMEIVHPITGVLLFHSVSKMWNSSKYMFHYIPANADMAAMIAKGLIPFLRHEYGE